jgi:hypothetical protein
MSKFTEFVLTPKVAGHFDATSKSIQQILLSKSPFLSFSITKSGGHGQCLSATVLKPNMP